MGKPWNIIVEPFSDEFAQKDCGNDDKGAATTSFLLHEPQKGHRGLSLRGGECALTKFLSKWIT